MSAEIITKCPLCKGKNALKNHIVVYDDEDGFEEEVECEHCFGVYFIKIKAKSLKTGALPARLRNKKYEEFELEEHFKLKGVR
ncbi:hypothetical protein DMB95_08960 [Campylobacter sp. MIT 12-8780]|uniref:hypothetical protein n=1 Tax=unclassified Campylobacter TaxID=2593542 RepID=UPI00115CF235|nr:MULTISPECIES: hypothetical protein [unclassified Campylobacter]NDJ27918.1 hypothetical protein [Campylobacter sp. MIT 19-121]TQR40149.1 hypothetical protein DMB95_08960 [Campylobacter sp. MIT 12-8780]